MLEESAVRITECRYRRVDHRALGYSIFWFSLLFATIRSLSVEMTTIPGSGLSICFSDLCYSVQGNQGQTVSILKAVNGAFLAGKMTAVVGPGSSQAKGPVKGLMRRNGSPLNFQATTAYK